MNKVFIDSNVILDFLDMQRERHSEAKRLFKILLENGVNVYFSEDILTTVYYVSKNKRKVLIFFKKIIDKWNIVAFNKNAIKQAIDISSKNNLDLEDVLQCLCARENGCEVFITNDKKFYNCGIEIMTSKEFIEQFS